MPFLLALAALFAAPAFAEPWPEARLGPLAHWDAAYDAATGGRTGKREGTVRQAFAVRAEGDGIERIDFPCRDVPHCLKFTWMHEGEGGRKYDDRRCLFAPGVGRFVAERRR
ncbi:MAG: hypothetical protein L6R19_28880 [Alphaproteobacteria bacterium]|nr:hypothetical protein [Alphaproteobacteria bacterium]